jgi:hypothetical protein
MIVMQPFFPVLAKCVTLQSSYNKTIRVVYPDPDWIRIK